MTVVVTCGRQQYDDEVDDLTRDAEVQNFVEAPANSWKLGRPVQGRRDHGDNKYLWLVTEAPVPYALEEGPLGQSTRRGRLAHTNLSGGQEAYSGGECWFHNDTSIWLTGGSSRYQPRSAQELEAIIDAFRAAGYQVANCGWSEEINGPSRYFRGRESFG